MALQDEVIILSSINNFLWELQSLSNKVSMHSSIIDLSVLSKHIFRMIYRLWIFTIKQNWKI